MRVTYCISGDWCSTQNYYVERGGFYSFFTVATTFLYRMLTSGCVLPRGEPVWSATQNDFRWSAGRTTRLLSVVVRNICEGFRHPTKGVSMKTSRHIRTLVTVLFVSGLAGACAPAADEPTNRRLLRIAEFTVKPGEQAAFEEAWAEQNARLEAGNFAFNQQVSQSGRTYRVIRFMQSWERFEDQIVEFGSLAGDPPRAMFESTENITSSILRGQPDLTYIPENPRVAQDEYGFIRYMFFHTYPGTGRQVEDVIRRNTELRRSLGLGTPMIVTRNVVGNSGPMWLFRWHYRDIMDFYRTQPEEIAAMGQEFQDQFAELASYTRHIEMSNNTVRRDLSYQASN